MSRLPSSIFNDVIGPVMIGPSSSHTAGPTRIGQLAGQLLDAPFIRAQIAFETSGSFARTYQGQKSDQGLIAGLLGWSPDDHRLSNALAVAKDQGREIIFRIEDFEAPHPNTVEIDLESTTGETATVTGLSVGGGVIELVEINGFQVKINGGYWEHLIFIHALGANHLSELNSIYSELGLIVESIQEYECQGQALINVKSHKKMDFRLVSRIERLPGVVSVKQLQPVMPVLASEGLILPFTTATQLQKYCAKGITLWEAACHYEAARGNITESEVLSLMNDVVCTMKESLLKGLAGNFQMRGFLTPSAAAIEEGRKANRLIPTGVLDKATVYATAIMEYNSSMGRVVAAPTAGSCGVLPAVIFSTAEELGLDNETIVKAMLCAGIVGVFIAEQATFAAEVCGCQAECGSAACMAAAASAWMNGADVDQAMAAASLALQNMLGLICDPVAEQVEIPCISRNVAAAANAVTAANMVMFGFNATIPLDEVIQAMYAVGNQLPSELRCTGKGGLCLTETGQRIKLGLQ